MHTHKHTHSILFFILIGSDPAVVFPFQNVPLRYWWNHYNDDLCPNSREIYFKCIFLSSFSPSLSVSSLAKVTSCLAYTRKCKCLEEQACAALLVPRDLSLAAFGGHRQPPYHRISTAPAEISRPSGSSPESLSHWFAMCSAFIRIYRVIQKMVTV